MNVTLYTFSKKHNSTAVPTGGTSVDVVLKDEAGVLDPIIELHTSASPSAYNYLYIPTFGRYYWLREWTYNRGIWIGSFYVDPMASWRSQIGAQQLYIYRSAYEYDGRIIDGLYPITADCTYQHITIPDFIQLAPPLGVARDFWGMYVVSVIVGSETRYLGMTLAYLRFFIEALMSDDYFLSVSGASSITPEIKTSINPMQYISSIKYYPMDKSVSEGTWGAIHYSQLRSQPSIKVGPGTVTMPLGENFMFYDFDCDYLSEMEYTIALVGAGGYQYKHPQEDDRGVYLRTQAYTTWQMFLPPFGNITLQNDLMANAATLFIKVAVDVRTGDAALIVYGKETPFGPDTVIVNTTAPVGIDFPITGSFRPGANAMSLASSLVSGIGAMLTGNIEGVFSATQNAINTYAAGTVPVVSTVGSQGSASQMIGTPCITQTCYYAVNDDVVGRGRPLCDKRVISTIPGYITADPDELSIAASARELEEIRGFITGGFFYE